jgi:2-phospho-L-lactate/phosphoenolpyruvate guanylyltransferase
MTPRDVWAVVPVKEFARAKERLARGHTQEFRRLLAAAMVEDVLRALTKVKSLAGIMVVTVDPTASALARRLGARVLADGAQSGHTAAVIAGMNALRVEGVPTMLTIPGDVPGVTSAEIEHLLAEHGTAPAFTITPAHDNRGSNAILASPPDLVPLTFGTDSFLPHLESAREHGVEPKIIRLDGVGLDIDNPEDLAAFARKNWRSRTLDLLAVTADQTNRWAG